VCGHRPPRVRSSRLPQAGLAINAAANGNNQASCKNFPKKTLGEDEGKFKKAGGRASDSFLGATLEIFSGAFLWYPGVIRGYPGYSPRSPEDATGKHWGTFGVPRTPAGVPQRHFGIAPGFSGVLSGYPHGNPAFLPGYPHCIRAWPGTFDAVDTRRSIVLIVAFMSFAMESNFVSVRVGSNRHGCYMFVWFVSVRFGRCSDRRVLWAWA
jgi:hypothetical protein